MGIVSNLISFLNLIYPVIFSILVDRVFLAKDINMFLYVFLMYIGIFVAEQVMHFFEYKLWAFHYHKYLYDLKKSIYSKMIKLKAEKLDILTAGECNTLLQNDAESCFKTVNWFVNDFCMNVIRYIFHFVCLSFINWRLSLVFMVLVPLLAFISQLSKKVINKYSNTFRDLYSRYSSHSIEFFRRLKELRLMKGELNFSKKLNKLLDAIQNLDIKKSQLEAGMSGLYSFINTIFLLLFFYLASVFISKGTLTIGSYLAAYTYFGSSEIVLNTLLNVRTTLQWNLAGIDRVMAILNEPEEKSEYEYSIDKIENIAMHDVSLSYAGNVAALSHVNLKIQKGEKVAIIGLSGSGKTSLLNLIARFYEPSQGIIKANNLNIQQIDIRTWREKISYLLQDPVVFDGTIKDNLLIANMNATNDDLKNACQKAKIWDFITSLPEQLDTILDEKRELSGGQRQRLGIARALLKESGILFLDESTSALDYKTEDDIMNIIFELPDTMVIMVTHRYRHVSRFDKIVLLNQGSIIAYGDHKHLLESCPLYVELINKSILSDKNEKNTV